MSTNAVLSCPYCRKPVVLSFFDFANLRPAGLACASCKGRFAFPVKARLFAFLLGILCASPVFIALKPLTDSASSEGTAMFLKVGALALGIGIYGILTAFFCRGLTRELIKR